MGNPPADLATADLGALEAAAPAVHREEYRKTVAAGNRREAATTYDSWMRPTIITNALGEMSTRSMTPAGRLRQEQSAHGGHYQYQWDIAGTMTSAGELGKTAVRATYNPDGTVATVTNRLGETTGYGYNSRTGLYNYGYRDYNPQTVRFTTVDPIRDGSNWFAYVNNDPVNYVDLWGLSASDVTAYKIPIAEIGGTLVVGANVELAFVFDTANNRGIAISVDGGVGISANIDLPIPAILNVILNRTINSATNLETISGTIQDFEGTYATTSVHAIGGVEMDLNNPQAAEFSIALSLGGGVYWGYTKVIEFIDGDGKK